MYLFITVICSCDHRFEVRNDLVRPDQLTAFRILCFKNMKLLLSQRLLISLGIVAFDFLDLVNISDDRITMFHNNKTPEANHASQLRDLIFHIKRVLNNSVVS